MSKNIISLFDVTGNAGRPWAEEGCHVHCYDIQTTTTTTEHVGTRGGRITYHHADIMSAGLLFELQALKPVFGFSFPPCTDLASSGARHFAAKLVADKDYKTKALAMVFRSRDLMEACGVSGYYIENPVGVISTAWRKPNHLFNPFEFGGYLPVDDVHPTHPDIIPARDAYTKRTCLWVGGSFTMPTPCPVDVDVDKASVMHLKLGGRSLRTKNIRSATPRGFAVAIMRANYTTAMTYRTKA